MVLVMSGKYERLSDKDRADVDRVLEQAEEAKGRIDAYESLLDCVWRCEADWRLTDRIIAGGTYQ